ncbi:phage tail assembly protein [Escherichia coli]|uniref:phage tail assembly protein n=1 Tax=Escherichia coli TaxID=562 RepID=UPI000FBF73AD|nr:phage tail assembly protein [Escherichia coli]EEC8625657.1 phage tail assembly protein [Escherichia coli]MCM4241674.1 phage tail assembly protein [Escherichia coli]HCB7889888.1 phage tail assembly protein [Escherichia coli]
MKELELKKPITAHGETLSVLEFDEPTGKDVRELGYPYQMNQDESVRLLAHVVSKYIVRLENSVDQMSPADLNAAAWLVAGFFLQA